MVHRAKRFQGDMRRSRVAMAAGSNVEFWFSAPYNGLKSARTTMPVEALGYVRARAKDLGDWASYGGGLLGLQRVDKTRTSIAFRMDDRKQRIIVNADGGEGIDVFGWEVKDAAALDALAAKLEAAGVEF